MSNKILKHLWDQMGKSCKEVSKKENPIMLPNYSFCFCFPVSSVGKHKSSHIDHYQGMRTFHIG
jgi:hypothetical protein